MRALGAFWLLVLALCCGLSVAQKRCFYPNGAGAETNYPCDPDADDSVCCGGEEGAVCLSNKLCMGPAGNTTRESCTDKSWNSPECAHYCLGTTKSGADLTSCKSVTGSDTSFCCNGNGTSCCGEEVSRFEVLPSSPQVIAKWDASLTRFVVVGRASSSSASDRSSAATRTANQPTPNQTRVSADSASTSDQNQEEDSSSGLSVGAKAGIGAGAGALGIALIAVAFLLYKLHKKKRRLAELEKSQQQQQQQPGQQELDGTGRDMKYLYEQQSATSPQGSGGGHGWYPSHQSATTATELETEPPAREIDGTPINNGAEVLRWDSSSPPPARELDGTGLRAELDTPPGWFATRV